MKRTFLIIVIAALAWNPAGTSDKTLRLDYIFTGGCSSVNIALSRMSVMDG